MFISKKDLEKLKEELRAEFDKKLQEATCTISPELIEKVTAQVIVNLPQPRPKTKKSVE